MIKDTRRNVVTMNEKEYYNLIKPYEDAMQMILSRLDTLNILYMNHQLRILFQFIISRVGLNRKKALKIN